jgi:peptidoglycan/LPS O-acetylase OafA/YrhL
MSSNRVSYLDALRVTAIVGVISSHTAQTVGDIQRGSGGEIDGWLLSFFNQGAYGVQVFFFLSGFLLAMLYGFSNLDVRSGVTARAFWVKRLFRIWPLWALFFLFTALRPLIFPQSPGGWPNFVETNIGLGPANDAVLIVLQLTFLIWLVPIIWGGVIAGGWSIQAEMLHYAFFALLRKRKLETILGAWILLAVPTIVIDKLLIRVDLDLGVLEGWRSQNFPSTALFFLAGSIAYLLGSAAIREKLSSASVTLSGVALITLVLLPLNNVKSGQAFAAFGFVVFALGISYVLGKFRGLDRPLHVIAKYSYFSYFFHFLALDYFEWLYLSAIGFVIPGGQIGVGLAVVVLIALTTATSTLFGSLSWKAFEGPLVRLSAVLAVKKANRYGASD